MRVAPAERRPGARLQRRLRAGVRHGTARDAGRHAAHRGLVRARSRHRRRRAPRRARRSGRSRRRRASGACCSRTSRWATTRRDRRVRAGALRRAGLVRLAGVAAGALTAGRHGPAGARCPHPGRCRLRGQRRVSCGGRQATRPARRTMSGRPATATSSSHRPEPGVDSAWPPAVASVLGGVMSGAPVAPRTSPVGVGSGRGRDERAVVHDLAVGWRRRGLGLARRGLAGGGVLARRLRVGVVD